VKIMWKQELGEAIFMIMYQRIPPHRPLTFFCRTNKFPAYESLLVGGTLIPNQATQPLEANSSHTTFLDSG
jgi:hypothetical protein